jgi:branched-chain amino acid transport system permease protein
MTTLVAALVGGIVIGCIYALIGVSLNVIYRPTNVLNMAQGSLVVLGLMLTWDLQVRHHISWIIVVVAVPLITAALALVVELVAVIPAVRGNSNNHSWIISTLAASLIITDLSTKQFGSDTNYVPASPGLSLSPLTLGPITINGQQLAILGLAVVVVLGAVAFYRVTATGQAAVAVAEDPGAAALCGISSRWVRSISFAISGALIGLTAVAAVPLLFASTGGGFALMINGFICIAIGGLGSSVGALMGGLLIGITQSAVATYAGTTYRESVTLLVLLLVLIALPTGFMGRREMRTV